MKILNIVMLVFLFCSTVFGAVEIDAGIEKLSGKVAASILSSNSKKIAVLDFTDLQGQANNLGRYFAEQLSVALVNSGGGFVVVDRSRMNLIMDQLKTNASALINPDEAKRVGKMSGVDALVIGTLTIFEDTVSVTVKSISIETTDVLGATSASFARSKNLNLLIGGSSASAPSSAKAEKTIVPEPPTPKFIHRFSGGTAELVSFRIGPGGTAFATIKIENTSKNQSLAFGAYGDWANRGMFDHLASKMVDQAGTAVWAKSVSGATHLQKRFDEYVADSNWADTTWLRSLTELKPGESLQASFDFGPRRSRYGETESAMTLQNPIQIEFAFMTAISSDAKPRPRLATFVFSKVPVSGL